MKLKKILKKLLIGFFIIKGFGILEMSIAGIIGASLTGSIIQVTQNQQEEQSKMEIQFDMMEAIMKVSELLSDPSSCENSLKGFNVNSSAGAITSFKTKFNKVLYNTTDIYGNRSFKIKSIDAEGDFATIKTTRQTGGYDIRSFKFHLEPEQYLPDLKVGMSVLFKIEQEK